MSSPRRSRLGPWVLALSLWALPAAATAVLWRPLGTFPVITLAFWASSGFVLLAWLSAALGLLAASRRDSALLVACTLLPAFALQALGLTGRFVFPDTFRAVWLGPAVLGVLWSVAALPLLGTLASRRHAVLALCVSALVGAPFGVIQVLARRPRTPAGTRPLNLAAPESSKATPPPQRLRFDCAGRRVDVLPFLSFESTSRDGFWPRAGPPDILEGPPEATLCALQVEAQDGGLTLEASTELPHAVHSHLNRFLELQLRGFDAPTLAFDALGPTPFPLKPFDYPHGRPAHFAVVTEGGELRVARGSDAEKGPFVELGRGLVPSDGVLSLALLDGAVHIAHVDVDGFVAQADLGPSPTAGFGMPANVLQFGVPPRQPPGEATPVGVLHLSLAESGIGEGLDTVTHAAGRYWLRVALRCEAAAVP